MQTDGATVDARYICQNIDWASTLNLNAENILKQLWFVVKTCQFYSFNLDVL